MSNGSKSSQPSGRLRWATQRVPGQEEGRKRRSTIMRAFSGKRSAVEKESEGQAGGSGSDRSDDSEATEVDDNSSQRRIFVNQPLPPDALDEDGSPSQYFSRNKIRTAKYTPLMFIPKNLWLQFHNVANVYFLFVTILAVWPSSSIYPSLCVCDTDTI